MHHFNQQLMIQHEEQTVALGMMILLSLKQQMGEPMQITKHQQEQKPIHQRMCIFNNDTVVADIPNETMTEDNSQTTIGAEAEPSGKEQKRKGILSFGCT